MSRSLFDENERITEEGVAYTARVKAALLPILTDAAKDGVRLMDFLIVVSTALRLEVALHIARRDWEKHNVP